jgi:hypothetical protein
MANMVNGKFFHTLEFDLEKRSHNSDVCVPTVDGKTYFKKLIEVIEIEYFDRTKYVLFKCKWAHSMRGKGNKEDDYDLIFVNFKNLVHKGEMIINESYVLMLQVDQVFYVDDERDRDWTYTVKTKPKNMYNVDWGERPHDVCENHHECEPLIRTNTNYYNPEGDVDYIQLDLDPIEAYVI